LLFFVVISEHFSKNRIIICAMSAKIWYLKNVRFLLGHPVCIASSVDLNISYFNLTGYLHQLLIEQKVLHGDCQVAYSLSNRRRHWLT